VFTFASKSSSIVLLHSCATSFTVTSCIVKRSSLFLDFGWTKLFLPTDSLVRK
jgi:hypothetical protein